MPVSTRYHHVAFNVGSMDDIQAMKRRAQAHGVEVPMEADHGWCHSIDFLDPNEIMVEFTTDTDAAAFSQTPEEALRLLRQSPHEISPGHRKDESTGVKVKR
jgi:hypothetical protein